MKIFFATYIDDFNPSRGDIVNDLEACLIRDEEGKVLYTTNRDDMLSLCKNDANLFIDTLNNSNRSEEHNHQIIDTDNGCAVIDDEDYRIVTYDIHELDLNIEVK